MRVVIERSEGPWEVEVAGASANCLAVLLLAWEQDPTLGFRFGCRDARCGTCTVEIDGRPRLACRDRVRDGSVIGPLSTLPVLRDLIVDRHGLPARVAGALPPPRSAGPAARTERQEWLDRCIDCLACLDGCPLHEAGRGDPLSLLTLRRVVDDPQVAETDRHSAQARAEDLGVLEVCPSCEGCRCGVGIPLVREVIRPFRG